MSAVPLQGGLEVPLCEAVKVKPRLPWRPHDVGDARAVGHLQRELLTGSGASPGERSVLASTKLKGVGDLKNILTSDVEMQSLEFPAGFWSCVGAIFPRYASFPMF